MKIKICTIRAGTYNIGEPLVLTAADTGETWQYHAADGLNTAVLEGGASTGSAFVLTGAQNVTINGIKMQNFTGDVVNIQANSNYATIENNEIAFETVAPLAGTAIAVSGILSVESQNVTIKHNYLHDLAGQAIGCTAFNAGTSINGTVITGNVILNATLQSNDVGVIACSDKATGITGGHVTISNNFIRGWGAANYNNALSAIYLDDNASNFTITGNIIGPPNVGVGQVASSGSAADQAIAVHNGNNNTISGNIIDIGSAKDVRILFYGFDGGSLAGNHSGQTFESNIIISRFGGAARPWCGAVYDEETGGCNKEGVSASWYTIRNNLYWNFGGGEVLTNGTVVGDNNPLRENPQCSGHLYALSANSPAFKPPVDFPPIVGGWGPPGFVIPSDSLHSCP